MDLIDAGFRAHTKNYHAIINDLYLSCLCSLLLVHFLFRLTALKPACF